MISLVLCLAVLTSFGAATVVPPHNEDVSTNTRQWQDLSGTAQQSVLFKRMNRGHDNFDPFESFGGFFDHQNDIPNAQPSSGTASQSRSHGILPDESHNSHETYLPAAWDMSHYQSYAQYPSDFYAQDPSDFYTQSDYWSHDSHIQPHGQDFPETHSPQHLSHDHDSTGSGDEKIKSKRKRKQRSGKQRSGKQRSEASERDQSSRSKWKASQGPSDRKVAQPKFPEKVTTREQLEVAMTFYRHEQTFKETNNKNDLLLLPEEAAVLSKKMKKLCPERCFVQN
ncbi:hypothetical protein FA10DRAFT_262560 [Acaromyces ingoldii]|uniref:Uncharacterized protein n=1 Tax=Acaromyces ingoldii TaxID=215250 RepID=A0A316YFL5_9BASI|nr:hypothetical protein FA10DRAFT_262560 [Acaromyces ingoldii]PWN87408.1 hypothetical protein FA10DRAFT_262560 [Acaromyces ingoldii]